MKIAIKIHKCLTNGTNSHELLDMLGEITDKNMLAKLNEFFLKKYNHTPHEFIAEKFKVKEVYAIDSTLKYIRTPDKKNRKKRDKFCKEIGYKFKK